LNNFKFQCLPITISPCTGLRLKGGDQENITFQDKNLLVLFFHPLGFTAETAKTGSKQLNSALGLLTA
jgi:hypothetical protein